VALMMCTSMQLVPTRLVFFVRTLLLLFVEFRWKQPRHIYTWHYTFCLETCPDTDTDRDIDLRRVRDKETRKPH